MMSIRCPGAAWRAFVALFALVVISGCDHVEVASAPDAPNAPGALGRGAPAGVIVVHGATIHTLDPGRPLAEALAFDGQGQILAVGEDVELMDAYPDALRLDRTGRTVIPGLIDAHGHLHGLALSLTRAQLAGTASRAEIIERLKAQEAELAEGVWLLGRGWDQNDWPVAEFPDRADLDEHFPDRPVWLRRIDGHAAWANSAALAQADRDLSGDWQVDGGMIHRDPEGNPTGIFIDRAMALVEAVVPPTSDAAIMDAIDQAIAHMLSVGLTGVHDPGIDRVALDRFQRKLARGLLHTRLYAMTDGTGATLDWLCENGPVHDPSERLFMRATKLYGDGALGSRGAALLADYSDDPGNRGLLFLERGAMQAQIDRVLGCGFQVAVHAIGDRANRVVIDALAASMATHQDNPGRHRVEHAQVLSAPDLGRFAELGLVASMQPTHATSDMPWAEQRLGPERIRFAYAWRSLLDSGAQLAFGSDFPVEAVDPRLGLYAAVTRMDLEGTPAGGWTPRERVTRESALRGFTIDAARAGFMENLVGSLEAGKRADFLVLDRDYMSIPAEQIPRMVVLETWLDGERVFAVE